MIESISKLRNKSDIFHTLPPFLRRATLHERVKQIQNETKTVQDKERKNNEHNVIINVIVSERKTHKV